MPGKPTAPSTLSGHAADIWQSAFASAYDGTCKERSDRDACAASIAWSAVKNVYKKKSDSGKYNQHPWDLIIKLAPDCERLPTPKILPL
jgi:cation transport regulator ChaB